MARECRSCFPALENQSKALTSLRPGLRELTSPKKSNSTGFQKAQRPFFEVNAAPPAPASSPQTSWSPSLPQTDRSRRPAKPFERTSFPVRLCEVQPDLENTPAALLARISEALASTNSNDQAIVRTNLLLGSRNIYRSVAKVRARGACGCRILCDNYPDEACVALQ